MITPRQQTSGISPIGETSFADTLAVALAELDSDPTTVAMDIRDLLAYLDGEIRAGNREACLAEVAATWGI